MIPKNLAMCYNIFRNGSRVILLLILPVSSNNFGIIMYPGHEPLADFSDIDIPDPNVVGRWESNASCVIPLSDTFFFFSR